MRYGTRIILAALVGGLIGSSSLVVAGGYNDGVVAYQRGDYATALKEFRVMAEDGFSVAQYSLGNMYFKGLGVTQDYKEAMKWFRLAAEQGYPKAQNNLGAMYDFGLGVHLDNVRAHKWYNISATNGNKLARKNRDIVEKRMTVTNVLKSQKLAKEWLEKNKK